MANAYRDGERLVVSLRNPELPPRCIKTNADLPAADYDFSTEIYESQIRAHGARGQASVGETIENILGKDMYRNKMGQFHILKFRIGLLPSLQNQTRRRRLIAIGLMLGGIVAAVISHLVLSAVTADKFGQVPGWTLFVTVGAFSVLLIAGLIVFAFSEMSILQVDYSDGEYVWLKGAGADFLNSLPKLPGSA